MATIFKVKPGYESTVNKLCRDPGTIAVFIHFDKLEESGTILR